MDVGYIALTALLWLAVYGLAIGCRRLQGPGARS